ncbi:hypothetical protein B0H19DRAFT_1274946 [Mycena capillaripes]|nr:hypothetical protein B0H19DRAFT_1274946 [Mycena capillaripes]
MRLGQPSRRSLSPPTSEHGYTLLHRGVHGRRVGAAQKLWLGPTNECVKYLTSVLHDYFPMKSAHYEDVAAPRAKLLRYNEMKGARVSCLSSNSNWETIRKKHSNNICITGALTVTASFACNLSVLGPSAALAAHRRQPLEMFTVVSTLNLMTGTLEFIGGSLPQLFSAAFQRQWTPIVVGLVASSKTMLLLSLPGEMTCTQGSSSVPGVLIAYTAQEPPLRGRILVVRPRLRGVCPNVGDRTHRRRERDVFHREGDEVERGPEAARPCAIYSNATWTLLDNPLSALDAKTADHGVGYNVEDSSDLPSDDTVISQNSGSDLGEPKEDLERGRELKKVKSPYKTLLLAFI